MAYSYLVPYLLPLPVGYDCSIKLPPASIGRRLINGSGQVLWRINLFHNGECIHQMEQMLVFENQVLTNEAETLFFWNGSEHDWDDNSGFVEMHFDTADEDTHFSTNDCIQIYGLYSAPNQKTFRADGAYKFASPPIINQIASFGVFSEGYSALCIDRSKGYGESLCLVNPYEKAILAKIQTHDDRPIKRTRIAPLSAANIVLTDLLEPEEKRFVGRLQISASNRLIAFHVRHSITKPFTITDHEHFDPYRDDPTHVPAFQKFRMMVGRFLDQRFGINWHRR
ncbi:MAG TPA: hypothetical protein DCS82_11990 [Rhodospirillaceae bacterium]|nr:hypothetical protein [Rhodospirillaceae bacterium]HAA91184.1 hypothetical protein [Rhodospirillaceae bacterium]HAT36432.1 hypothetical protein [Rhodospirillaceae bacterium]|tara:strand:+ start:291 stop:1136 length:846 start_codon:yes stop_codon:yes gene_type:complete